MEDLLTEWGFGLKQTLEAQLRAGSFGALFVAYAAGVLTSFTPCVYPMIPVIVTFMGGAAGGNRRRAVKLSLAYVSGMSIVYACLGVLSAMLGWTFGADFRSPWIFGAVALLMVLFGLAMLDAFTIPIPGFAGTVHSQGATKGGVMGALMMGTASGFVAAPCAAPVLGFLLVWIARSGDVAVGGVLMLAFSLGLGTLLLALGIFSGLLTSLPRAGVWMKVIKVVCGIVMLAIGGWFALQAALMVLRAGAA